MKKNININISGIIFYIEEDGYDRLKQYLLSIHKYFSAFEDSAEIIADIENRIAEIFLSKLGENRQVITIEDIEDLITTMGSVADFQAIEDDNFVKSSTKSANSSASQSKNEKQTNKNTTSSFNFDKTDADYQTNYSESANQSSYTTTESRKLLRDNKRKLLGGVASGIAHYLSVDPLWVRLMFLATLFDWFFFVSISGVAFFSYILIWALVPASNDLEDDSRVKKLFRNPENKVLGGVAGGLAAYFGVEVTLVRVLLALGMFLGGTTIVAYLILWAITPEARTLTEKMEMEGEPITLKNIEEKIKENLNIDHDKEETLFAKILLFPFRLIAQIFAILTPLIQPFGGFVLQALRVVLGAGFVVKGFALIVAFTFALLAFTGYFDIFMTDNPNGLVHIDGFPIAMIRELAPTFGIYSMYVVLLIPSISLVIIGISLIAKRKIVGNIFAWSLFGVWIVSLGVASTAFADVAKKFKTQQTVEKATNYAIKSKLLVLDLIEQEEGFPNEDVSLTIKGYEGETAQLIRFITARGENKEIATANAGMVSYTVKEENDKLIFSRYFGFKDEANYRGQNLSLKLYLPYNQEFTMTEDLARIISNTVSPYGYDREDITNEARWVFKEEQGLICLNCKKKPKHDEDDENSNEIDESETFKKYDFKDFDALVINSTIDVKIEQGNEFSIKAYSDSEDFEGIKVVQNGRTLTINATESQNPDMIIVLPKLVSCVVNGDGELVITNFVGETLLLTVSDASDVDARLNFDNLICKLNGKANLDLSGKVKNCDFYIDGASTLDAANFITQTGKIEANGASNAEITAEKTFEVNSLGVSKVEIQGEAEVKGRGNYKKEE
jgi:phage shock protein PspC (stress-responsive transcriptional regulator)